jgi:hypothetical protein
VQILILIVKTQCGNIPAQGVGGFLIGFPAAWHLIKKIFSHTGALRTLTGKNDGGKFIFHHQASPHECIAARVPSVNLLANRYSTIHAMLPLCRAG